MTFSYHRPRSLEEAWALLSLEGAVALAGGTDLLIALRHREVRPLMVVDIKSVDGLGNDIAIEGDRLRIGGRVVMRAVMDDEMVQHNFPALVEAASVVGSVQIRNRATLAGNLCNASPAADTAPALIAYSAVVGVVGPQGNRVVLVEDFFTGPGKTVLDQGDLVAWVDLPLPSGATGSAFARVTRRRGVDLASVSLACVVDHSGRARFGFGAVGPTPLLAESTTDDLGDDEGWSRLLSVTTPITDLRAGADYRRAMLAVHSRRALATALERLRAAS